MPFNCSPVGMTCPHKPTLAAYGRMLSVFSPIRSGLVGAGLDASQLIRILLAKTHDY